MRWYRSDLEGLNYCFWVFKQNVRIGGIIIRPNHIEGLFLQPPHSDPFEVLQAVMPLLRSWSDVNKPIEAADVMMSEVAYYERLGFRINRGRRVYVRPTQPFSIQWPVEYQTRLPTRNDVQEVAELFYASFRNYPQGWHLGAYGPQDWQEFTEEALLPADMTDLCRQASLLIRDKARNLLIGACLANLLQSVTRPENQYANIAMMGVLPEYRQKGLATRMVQHTLSVFHGHYPLLKFGVAAGSTAEAFYYNLGFLPGPVHYVLLSPPTVERANSSSER